MTLDLELHKSRLNAYKIGTMDRQIDLEKLKIINDFANSPSYVSAIVNGTGTARGFHVLEDSFYRSDPSKKRIVAKPNETISTGDYLFFKNEYWLMYSETDRTNPVYESIRARKCNLTPFYYKVGSQVYSTYGFYDKNMTTNNNNESINLPNDIVMVSIPLNSNSKKIKKNDFFYIFEDEWHERYQIQSLDKTKSGIIIIKAKESQSDITPQEYYELEPVSSTSVGSVVVTPSTLSMTVNTTKQLTVAVYNKSGILMPDETVTWSSSNTAVASVDSSGLVTIVAVGSCEIIASSVTDASIVGKCVLSVIDQGGWF